MAVEDIGDVIANNIVIFFNDGYNREEIKNLLDAGVKIKEIEMTIENENVKGKTFVLTGSLSRPRHEIENLIESMGGKTASSVSKNTNYVLAGESAGSKLDKAKDLNIPVLSEQEFFDKFVNF